jgi:predicted peptidase
LRRLTALVFASVLIASGCTRESRFLERSVAVNGRAIKYRVWLPQHYTKLHQWPVVLYLHGSGERGDDNIRQLSIGLGPALQHFGERYKCIVVFPQCPYGHEWYGESEQKALAALEASIREFHGNRRRVYLTGISMGGAGAWYMARHGRRFAAVVPVCGEVARRSDDPFPSDPPPDIALIVGARDPYATLAAQIGPTPVWAFHGSDDPVIPATESRAMVAALKAIGGNVRYTEYVGVGHDVWDQAYADQQTVHWMLAQKMR